MPSKYFSQRDKIRDFLDNKILPVVRNSEVDYNLLRAAIMDHLGVSPQVAEEGMESWARLHKLKEHRFYTIPDQDIPTWLETVIKTEKERAKEADEILTAAKEAPVET